MKKDFGLKENQFKFLKDTLRRHLLDSNPNIKVWIFGSRARGDFKPASDVDLLLESPKRVAPLILAELRDAFEESSFPYKVDIVLSEDLAEAYRESVDRDKVAI